jgi:LCP family protein required for cell wall assembly
VRSSFARWRSRFFIAFVAASVLMGAGFAGGYAFINAKWSQAKTVKLKLNEGSANYLILGSDSREFVKSDKDAASFGAVGGTRADTLIVVRVDPKTKKALLVSFPRDLWVDIPGVGESKINAAFGGGPQRVVDTLKQNFDFPIHHYLEIDFAGFRNIVNAMGGVNMFVAAPSRDPQTGLDVQQPGCVTFDGDQALAWVRSRYFEFLEGGVWRSDPRGDFGRIERQQTFIKTLIGQAIASAATNPVRGNRLADRALENVTVDDNLSVTEVLRLARIFRSTNPDTILMQALPSFVSRHGAASTVDVDWPKAEPVFKKLRGDLAIRGGVDPTQVKVRVLNGHDPAQALATNTSAALQGLGFQPAGIADAEHSDYSVTEVRYRPGQKPAADLVKESLKGVGKLIEDEAIAEADVIVVIGADFKGVKVPKGDDESWLPLQPIASVRPQADTGQVPDADLPDARPAAEC